MEDCSGTSRFKLCSEVATRDDSGRQQSGCQQSVCRASSFSLQEVPNNEMPLPKSKPGKMKQSHVVNEIPELDVMKLPYLNEWEISTVLRPNDRETTTLQERTNHDSHNTTRESSSVRKRPCRHFESVRDDTFEQVVGVENNAPRSPPAMKRQHWPSHESAPDPPSAITEMHHGECFGYPMRDNDLSHGTHGNTLMVDNPNKMQRHDESTNASPCRQVYHPLGRHSNSSTTHGYTTHGGYPSHFPSYSPPQYVSPERMFPQNSNYANVSYSHPPYYMATGRQAAQYLEHHARHPVTPSSTTPPAMPRLPFQHSKVMYPFGPPSPGRVSRLPPRPTDTKEFLAATAARHTRKWTMAGSAEEQLDRFPGTISLSPKGKWMLDLDFAGKYRKVGMYQTREEAMLALESFFLFIKNAENICPFVDESKVFRVACEAARNAVDDARMDARGMLPSSGKASQSKFANDTVKEACIRSIEKLRLDHDGGQGLKQKAKSNIDSRDLPVPKPKRDVTKRPSGMWQTQIYFVNVYRFIGVFDTEREALEALRLAAHELRQGLRRHGRRNAEMVFLAAQAKVQDALYGQIRAQQKQTASIDLTKQPLFDSDRGVTQRRSGMWQAQIFSAGKTRYLGVFDTKQEALEAFNFAQQALQKGRWMFETA